MLERMKTRLQTRFRKMSSARCARWRLSRVPSSERSPLAPVFSMQKDDVAKNRSLAVLTPEVRLP